MPKPLTATLLVTLLALASGCSGAGPTATVDRRVAEHVRTWGGSEDEYRRIFALRDCDELERMMVSTSEDIADLPLDSEEQKVQIGYSQAILAQLTDLGC